MEGEFKSWLRDCRPEIDSKNTTTTVTAYFYNKSPKEMAEIARAHERERYMKIFDDLVWVGHSGSFGICWMQSLRTALFGEEKSK